jgi:hypothetical protein
VISLSDIFSGLELRHQMQVKLFNQFQQSRLRRTHSPPPVGKPLHAPYVPASYTVNPPQLLAPASLHFSAGGPPFDF